ncbi:helix-turn-helix transcriptional regulator [Mesorhizobium sp. B2-6-2]|nr:helix-turn-helix transcriptional regulator [Mesorhizobium sp. B2-6-2]
MVTAAQMRAARALIGLSQAELARRAGVSIPTIKRCESDSERTAVVSADTQDKVRAVLHAEGVEFTNGNYPGVRLRRP